jgi:hypothetical protein
MSMSKASSLKWIAAAVSLGVILALATYGRSRRSAAAAASEMPVAVAPAPARSGATRQEGPWGQAGAGWSVDEDTESAVTDALSKATLDPADGLTMLFYTPQHDPVRVARALAKARRAGGRTVAMTTHDGILTSDGYHFSEKGVVGALRLRLSKVVTGVGAASFEEGPPAEAARLALARAMADAGKTRADRPALLVLFSTVRSEETLLGAIGEEVGVDVPLIGGTAAGLVSAMERKTRDVTSSMIAGDRVIGKGVAITAFYSPNDIGLAFGGGFDRGSGRSGVITESDSRLIKTIDGQPAVDVYDQWLGGRLSEARAGGKNVQNALALYPLVQTVTKGAASHNQFIRAWPSGDQASPGSLTTGADIHVGETVYTSEGSENILLNHFSSLPRQARQRAGGGPGAAGLFFYCAGALQTIPREHRGVLAALVQRSMGNIPWIGVFSWGEQGSVPGIGYQHGNLMAGTAIFPAAPAN